jgi:hypothetical protein
VKELVGILRFEILTLAFEKSPVSSDPAGSFRGLHDVVSQIIELFARGSELEIGTRPVAEKLFN